MLSLEWERTRSLLVLALVVYDEGKEKERKKNK